MSQQDTRFKSKTYLTHFPVQSHLEADILSKESTWNVLRYIRRVGAGGVSADEVSTELDIPRSVVYSTLKELRRLEYIFTKPREKGKTKERKKRYVCERATWGKYGIDREFLSAIELEGIIKKITREIKEDLLLAMKDAFDVFTRKTELRAFLPTPNEENICRRCGRSHEAMEFVYALVLRAIDTFITDSEEFRKFLAARGYSK